MTETAQKLATRYGQTPAQRRRATSIGWVTAVGFAAVLGAWLWWGGVLEAPAEINTRDLGYVLVSDRQVEVRFEVTTAPGGAVSCAIQALSASYGVVGWKIVDLEPSSLWTRTFSETLRTSEPAVTGLLYECWVK